MGFGKSKQPQAPPPPPQQPPPTIDEIVKDEKRNIGKAQRDLDREANRLKQEEQKLIMEIKNLAAKGQNDNARVMAKQLVKNREQQKRLMTTKYNMGGVATNMTIAASQAKAGQVIGSANQAMTSINQTMDHQAMLKNVQQYEMQSEKMNMAQEMMDDAIDGGMNAELDAESEDILAQVLDDVALGKGSRANAVPQSKRVAGAASASADADLDAEVEQMLRKLKG
eukprot:CAMPEP_0184691604 /NCGR_PEP_ID=MMETSP0313-20130426/405_1 /TAXON_ID=2792 /ORGANISM="Porphyridium aerugineum, Strain SAG 1380-2" /LENGTH=224 /DNA_ID=CAMNT_0027149349 /DNA_START=105 /DNA_END=779 /DNA_ORIENTATION=+